MDESLKVFEGKARVRFYTNNSECQVQNTTQSGNILHYVRCGPYYSYGNAFPKVETTTTHLKFRNYKVSRLGVEVLWDLTELVYLDLSYNGIFALSHLAFYQQTKLKILNLEQNHLNTLSLEFAFPHTVFEPLADSLQLLNLNQYDAYSSNGSVIPISEVGVLKNLEGLVLDIVTEGNETIGPTFANLKSLRRLQLKLQTDEDFQFQSDFFKNIKGVELECLYMTSINGLIEGVYKILPGMDYLTLLDLQYSHLLFARDDLEDFWTSIGTTNIKTIDLTNTGLSNFYTAQGLHKLTSLLAGNNYFHYIFMEDILPNLRDIVMKFNQMSTLAFYNTLWYLMKYRDLEHVEINYQASSPFGESGPGTTSILSVPIHCSEVTQDISKLRYTLILMKQLDVGVSPHANIMSLSLTLTHVTFDLDSHRQTAMHMSIILHVDYSGSFLQQLDIDNEE